MEQANVALEFENDNPPIMKSTTAVSDALITHTSGFAQSKVEASLTEQSRHGVAPTDWVERSKLCGLVSADGASFEAQRSASVIVLRSSNRVPNN